MADFDYTFYWRAAFESLPEMLGGAWVTVQIAVLSMGLGTVLAVFLTLGAQSSRWMLRTPAALWVSVARNTPALFQVYMLYFGLGAFGLHLGSWLALVAGITFNNAGYLAETFRGGLKAIPSTQLRAARSLGMSAPQALRLVILPQLLRVVFYPLTNQFVWAVLMTSLGVVVGMTSDLAGVTQALNVRTFRTFEFFAIAAVLYYLLAKFVGVMTRVIAWRLFRY